MDLSRFLYPHLTRGESLASTLERMIFDGRIEPGERIPSERALAEQLGYSRGSVREALRDLSQKGLVVRKPGAGTIVQGFDASPMGRTIRAGLPVGNVELLQVMEVRACIEPPLAERAAIRATEQDVAQLYKIVEDTRAVKNGTDFATLDRSFHLAVAQYTYNPLLVSLLDKAQELAALSRSDKYLTPNRITTSAEEHQAIVEAIARRDAPGAFTAAAAHVASVQCRILQEAQE
jgi:GntR family transcriptional repressor for pyruvate dehydrogenase complex